MREIKFRVWNPTTSRMIYDTDSVNLGSGTILEIEKGKVYAEYQDEVKRWVLTNLMQFTGLLDKNGKEIYEGDIVQDYFGTKFEVVWDEFMFNLKDYYDGSADYPTVAFAEGVFKIIGNIYENPELLEGSE